MRPYRVPGHQHTPEMERGIELATGHRRPRCCSCRTSCRRCVACSPRATPRSRPGVTTEQLTACLAAAYDGQPFVRVLRAREMADSKRTRGTNVIELQAVADPRTGTAVVIGARRQPRQRRGRPGDPEREPRRSASTKTTGLPHARRSTRERRPSRSRGGSAPRASRPASSRADAATSALLVGDPARRPPALFTTNRVVAAPVSVARAPGRGRGAGRGREQRPGERGDGAARRRGRARDRARTRHAARTSAADDVLACSTGVIGEPLHVPELLAALRPASTALCPTGGGGLRAAIMTTDTVAKTAEAEAGPYRVGGARQGRGHDRPEPRDDARVRHDRRAGRARRPAAARRDELAPRVQRAHRRRLHEHERHRARCSRARAAGGAPVVPGAPAGTRSRRRSARSGARSPLS